MMNSRQCYLAILAVVVTSAWQTALSQTKSDTYLQTDYLGFFSIPNADDPKLPCILSSFARRWYALAPSTTNKYLVGVYTNMRLSVWETPARPGCKMNGQPPLAQGPSSMRMWKVTAIPTGPSTYSVEAAYSDSTSNGETLVAQSLAPFNTKIRISGDTLVDEGVDEGQSGVSAIQFFLEGSRPPSAAMDKSVNDLFAALFGPNCTAMVPKAFHSIVVASANNNIIAACQMAIRARTSFGEFIETTVEQKILIDRLKAQSGPGFVGADYQSNMGRAAYVAFRVQFEKAILAVRAVIALDGSDWKVVGFRFYGD